MRIAMEEVAAITRPVLFAYYARDDLETWKLVLGCQVTHKVHGRGTVVDVYRQPLVEPPDDITIVVQFDTLPASERRELRLVFAAWALGNGFSDLVLPSSLEHISSLQEEVRHLLGVQEERASALAETKRQEVEQREEAAAQREREAMVREEFTRLKKKYLAVRSEHSSPTSPLYAILQQVEAGEMPARAEVSWLEQKGFPQVLAFAYYHRYERSGDGWDLVQASEKWRQGGYPQQALAATKEYCSLDAQLMVAILTTRAAAQRDIGNLEEAEKEARAIVADYPLDYRPFNLLGAIQYQRGNPEQGDEYFRRANELGCSEQQDSFIKAAVRDADAAERRRVAQYLLQKDPRQYGWVRQNRW